MPLANHPNVLGGGSPGAGVELSGGTSLVDKGVLYADSGNTVTTEAAFIYTASTNTLTVDNVVSNAATALALKANGNVTVSTTNGSTLAATFSGANTTLAGNLTVSGTGTQTIGGAGSTAQVVGLNLGVGGANGFFNAGNIYGPNAGTFSVMSGNASALLLGTNGTTGLTIAPTTLVSTFASTTSGTSSTAAAILGKSMGLTENLYAGGAINSNDGTANMRILATGGVGYVGTSTTHDVIFQTGGNQRGRFNGSSGDFEVSLNEIISGTTEATTGGAGSLTTAGGIYATKKIITASSVTQTDATALIHTATALNNGAAAQVATMTNGPAAGNPTKWVPIDDNGTTRYIPAW